ncbi:putative reverse transcriptase domain-containing protein, partial [Tanacetum coccineum]
MHPRASTKREVLKVLAHAPMYNALLDKYLESLEFGKIRLLEETDNVLRLADRTKSYPIGIMRNAEVYVGKFKFSEDFYVIDMEKDHTFPLLVGREFLATASAIIDCKKANIEIEDGITRSLDPLFEDYIELNDLNEPFKIRINQGDDLMPTIEEGEVIEEFITMDNEIDIGIDDYPSYYNYDKKIHIDFLENIDAYRDEGMGDVIIGEPFLREVGIKTRRFKGMITIYNGNDEVTYQMVRSHP